MTPNGQEPPGCQPTATPPADPAPDARFRRESRLVRRQDYQAVYEHGTRLSGSLMTVFFLPNALGRTRLGIAATRKMGPATVRNRAKRRVREWFRRSRLSEAVDIVVIPRRDLVDAPPARLDREFSSILNRRRRASRG